jgi:epsilon-lactone hydrolase
VSELESIIRDIDQAFAELSPDAPLSAVRTRLDRLFGYQNPASGCSHQRLRIGEADAELIAPDGAERPPRVVLYLHGGGFAVCSIDSHRDLAERLALATPAAVLLLGYRLAPEHPYPAALDDALEAYQWLLANGYASSAIAVAGDSAGGNLALSTLLAIKERGLPLPGCGVALSPWVDLEMTGQTMKSKAEVDPIVKEEMLHVWVKCYAPDKELRHPLLSPLHGNFKGMPPLLVQVGGREALLDDSKRLVDAARQAGVQVEYQFWEHQIHVFQTFGHRLADARKAIADIGAFIGRHLSSAARLSAPMGRSAR